MKKVLKILKYKAGYEIRHEKISGDEAGGKAFIMKSAYTPAGDYIGDPKTAYFLVVKQGIVPEKVSSGDNVCSIGFCSKDNKWYGWSHRAIVGFGIGDKIFDEKYAKEDESVPFIKHGNITITSLE